MIIKQSVSRTVHVWTVRIYVRHDIIIIIGFIHHFLRGVLNQECYSCIIGLTDIHDGHDDRHLRSMNVPALLCHRPDIVAFMMQSDFLK